MRRSVEQGLIGEPYVIESRVEGSRGMPKGWRTIKSLGGGMMLDWGGTPYRSAHVHDS